MHSRSHRTWCSFQRLNKVPASLQVHFGQLRFCWLRQAGRFPCRSTYFQSAWELPLPRRHLFWEEDNDGTWYRNVLKHGYAHMDSQRVFKTGIPWLPITELSPWVSLLITVLPLLPLALVLTWKTLVQLPPWNSSPSSLCQGLLEQDSSNKLLTEPKKNLKLRSTSDLHGQFDVHSQSQTVDQKFKF